MDLTKSKAEKIQEASQLMEKSPAMMANLQMGSTDWSGILADLDEEKIDELLLILDEESLMHSDVQKEKVRKKEVNKTRYLQRLENLKIRAESLQYNAPNNG
jgi:hypothetical protein